MLQSNRLFVLPVAVLFMANKYWMTDWKYGTKVIKGHNMQDWKMNDHMSGQKVNDQIALGGKWLIDWVVVVCPTRHIIGHFGDVLPSQSIGLVLKN